MANSIFNNAAQSNMGFNSMDQYGMSGTEQSIIGDSMDALYGMPDISSPVGGMAATMTGGAPAAAGGLYGGWGDIFGGGDSGIFGSKGLMAGGMESLGLGGMSGIDALGGLNSLMGFGTSIAGLVQNKKQLDFAKNMYGDQLDMANEQNRMNAQVYNTQLNDRQASRSSAFSPEEMERYYGKDYIKDNTMSPNQIG